ncbi:hypothetical protein L9F63_010631 [Diploptera punctata]|uniref:Uncharacterized protein n=1 Tax=Diploptera punctata TaxID=6984 RepID=A0AAD8AI82_DIPPU|nr:hypothetical protein L9F63_010631 [Diploptera punctata]
MCEYFWEPLAEVHLSLAGRSSEENIYCLCSRVLIRDGDDLSKGMCEKADGSEDDSTQYDEYDSTSVQPFCMNNVVNGHQVIRAVSKHDTEEAVSCYCSASHTDNNYSTDEHEHDSGVGVVRSGLQLSDSGADLSECGGDVQYGSSNRHEDWEHYWSANGERIIWQSWIAKYGEYINPGYLEQQDDTMPIVHDSYDSSQNETNQNDSSKSVVKTDVKNKGEDLLTSTLTKSDMMISTNDDSNTSLSDRWSPLSPSSTDDSSGDGGVVGGSVANTALTSDSMTNVTKITVSSLDLSYGDMEDSIQSSSLSSSSASSGSASGTADDADRYWQDLWKRHFNEQYFTHYNAFLTWEKRKLLRSRPNLDNISTSYNKNNTELNIVEDYYSSIDILSHEDFSSMEKLYRERNISVDDDTSGIGRMELSPGTDHSLEELDHEKHNLSSVSTPKKNSSKKGKSRLLMSSVGHLLKSLSMLDSQSEPVDSPVDAGKNKASETPEEVCNTGSSTNENTTNHGISLRTYKEINDGGDEPPEERPVTLKRSHESDS